MVVFEKEKRLKLFTSSIGNYLTVLAEFFCKTTVCLFATFSDLFFSFLLPLHVLNRFDFFADKV